MVPLLVLVKGGAYLLVGRIGFVFFEKAVSTKVFDAPKLNTWISQSAVF